MTAFVRRGELINGEPLPKAFNLCWDAVFPAEALEWLYSTYRFEVIRQEKDWLVVSLATQKSAESIVFNWNNRN